MAANDLSAATAELRQLCGRLLGTAAEHVSDPHYITNRACSHHGELYGVRLILSLVEAHLTAPKIAENDGSTHSEAFVPGVGAVQLSCWPRDYFADGEPPYLALMFAEAAPN